MQYRAVFITLLKRLSHWRAIALLVILALGRLDSSAAAAPDQGVVIIVSRQSTVKELTREQVADIFLGRSVAATSSWRPIDSSDESLREMFYQSMLGMTANRARAHWAQRVFASRQAPPREMSVDQAIDDLNHDNNGISYIFREQSPKGARELVILP